MANPYISSGGWEYSTVSVGGVWRWRVVANNIQSSTQKYYVTDISSPFGELVRVAQPIPGDVIEAMALTLEQFQEQLNPALTLVSGGSVSATVVEAGPKLSGGSVTFTNSGAIGSFMSVTASASVPWMTVTPGAVDGIGKNAYGAFNVSINPATLLSSDSPYTAYLNLYEPKTGVTVPVAFTVNVLPQSLILVNANSLAFTYHIDSNLASSPQTVTLQNFGPVDSTLTGYISKATNGNPWLKFTPPNFGPLSYGETTTFTVSLQVSSITKLPGIYSETLVLISDVASNSPVSIPVTLTVS